MEMFQGHASSPGGYVIKCYVMIRIPSFDKTVGPTLFRIQSRSFKLSNEQKILGCFGLIGGYTTQLCADCNEPL